MSTPIRFVPKNGIDNNSLTIINVADPVNAQDVSTKAYSTNATNLVSGTLPAARLPAFTGVVTTTAGSSATSLGSFTSAALAAALTDETGSGSAVFGTSPTLVTPALGTPSALVGTNITGTAAGLTAGTVTTNANMTGAITSVGNATSLGSFSSASLATALTDETGTGSAVFASSPTLITPALGTPSALVGTNITGTASGLTAGTVTTNANLTGEVTSVGNAATLLNSAVIGKVLTGYTSGAGTVAGTDTILQAVQKLNGNAALALPLTGGTMSGSIVIPTGKSITLTDAPIAGTDAANKNYVDANLAGLSWKQAVRAATTTNFVIATGGLATVVDGITLVTGDRVLVRSQTAPAENGIYIAGTGAWTRSTDMDAAAEINSAAVLVTQGTTLADTGWTVSSTVTTVGTSAVTWVQFNGAAGTTAGVGLSKSGNTLNVVLGAGVAELPTAEVGIDLWSGGGLILTTDGTASSTLTNAQLSLGKVGTASTYRSVTTDAYGRVTAGTNPTTLSGYGITDAQGLNANLTSLAALSTSTTGFVKLTAGVASLDTTSYVTTGQTFALTGGVTASGSLTTGTFAATVVTNANLTGVITSVGNTTSFGSITSATLAAALTDETGTGANVFATSPTLVTPLLGTPTSGVLTNCTGTAAGLTAGTVTTNANLTGDVTSVGNATTLAAATVTGKALTGFVSGAGTVTATDTILTAFNKLNGNVSALAPTASPTFTGTVTAPTYVMNNGEITSAILTTSATTANQIAASVSSVAFRSATFNVQATSGTSYHTTQVVVLHDGTNTWVQENFTMFTGSSLITCDANIAGGALQLLITPANAVTVIKTIVTAISV